MKLRRCINIKSVCFVVWIVIFILDLNTIIHPSMMNNLEEWGQWGVFISLFMAWSMMEITFLVYVPKYVKRLIHDYIKKVIVETEENHSE